MTTKQFEKYAKEGKTVLSMDFVEGREGMCTTGAAGDPQVFLDQIARKMAYIMLEVDAGSTEKVNIPQIIDTVADNAKVYYAKFAMYYANRKKAEDDTTK